MTHNHEPIILEPVFKDRIWGGTKLQELFGYELPSSTTGECWAISAHPHGQSVVKNGPFKGLTLDKLWTDHHALFSGDATSSNRSFPLLTKILDASADLSVQVHPDDPFAAAHENGELGKTECWYILAAEPGSEIIYGHRAESKEQLEHLIHSGQWEKLLCKVQVKPGDFFYVPSGTIHALGAGIVVLETQQSSDTTYRVYDYDRKDATGHTRELHLDKAVQVTTVPHRSAQPDSSTIQINHAEITTFVANEFFAVYKYEINGEAVFEEQDHYQLLSVIEGTGALSCGTGTYALRKGDHLILPAAFGEYKLDGCVTLIVSQPGA